MNYRHHFHAGNFADLIKHAALLAALAPLTAPGAPPLTVIDTHAGAGLYDLDGDMARKSGEAALGVARLIADLTAPAVFAPLKAAVDQVNPAGGLRFYPGSPWLTAQALRAGDHLTAYELRPEDALALTSVLKPLRAPAEVICADGFDSAPQRLAKAGAALILIDPPFERPDDYERAAAALAALLARGPAATIMIWTPLKDLETFDRLLRGIELINAPPTLVAETRLRPLDNPMRLNGCALTITNPPPSLEAALRPACDWIVERLGQRGGEARVWTL